MSSRNGPAAVRVGPGGRGHHDVAVLDAGVELDLAAELALKRVDHLGRGLGRRMPTGEVEHRAVVADRDEVAPVRDLIGRELEPERRGFDRRAPRVEPRRVVAEDRHVADVAARRQPGRDHRGPPDQAPRGQLREGGHGRDLERCAPAEAVERLVGTAVGDANDVLAGAVLHGLGG
jgi:hypothetical protein